MLVVFENRCNFKVFRLEKKETQLLDANLVAFSCEYQILIEKKT
jgi:hypothetical protein